MKRLVICCDGTWNSADSANVTNVEKIARAVEIDPALTGGVTQMVLYLPGVGIGYKVDRLLGGAFGLGLFNHVLAGYRFLAQNYKPGDEIHVFGFSRGAYTARSLVGMIATVGLITRDALGDEKLPEAVDLYQGRDEKDPRKVARLKRFKAQCCHPQTPIAFLGVFDTVGALGVPGALRKKHQFHNVTLSSTVQSARQALAVDEPRMKFEPCLWDAMSNGDVPDERVRQVWFEGCHSDVGGGYKKSGLADIALLWMVAEASRQGLVFDGRLLGKYVARKGEAVRHDPAKAFFKALDAGIRLKIRLGRHDGRAFVHGQRRLHRPDCLSVRVAGSTAQHYRTGEDYKPRNLRSWAKECGDFADCEEPVVALPGPTYDEVVAELAKRGIVLGGRTEDGEGPEVPLQRAPTNVPAGAAGGLT